MWFAISLGSIGRPSRASVQANEPILRTARTSCRWPSTSWLRLRSPNDLEQARSTVSEAVRIYNSEQPQLALKYKTPDAVHRAFLGTANLAETV